MAKKILAVYYTQSGQLLDILENFTRPLSDAGHEVEFLSLRPEKEFPFPWTGKSFFSVMPDCVQGITRPLQAFETRSSSYDLVVLAYQPWFLSPSIPVNSFLYHPETENLFKNTPVITITGARNMWISALERIKKRLYELEAAHVGNIALVDTHANLISVFTILYWMFTGKKDRMLGIFPKPGVSAAQISDTGEYGKSVLRPLASSKWENLQNELFEQNAVVINYNLMYTESKASRLFTLWARFISKRKNPVPWLVVFKYYLIIALFIAAPIILSIHRIFFKPFLRKRIKKQLAYYAGTNYTHVN